MLIRYPEGKSPFGKLGCTGRWGDNTYVTKFILPELLKLCLRSEDAFVITCVANLIMEVKVLYVQQDLRYEIYSYWSFNV
jgi:hypothetical protein